MIYTPEIDADIIRRRDAGDTFATIGIALGINKSAVKRRYRATVPYTGPMKPINEPLMRRLWDEGLSYRDIGTALGISKDSFDGYRKRIRLPPRPTKQPPCNILKNKWTDVEKAIVIAAGVRPYRRRAVAAVAGTVGGVGSGVSQSADTARADRTAG